MFHFFEYLISNWFIAFYSFHQYIAINILVVRNWMSRILFMSKLFSNLYICGNIKASNILIIHVVHNITFLILFKPICPRWYKRWRYPALFASTSVFITCFKSSSKGTLPSNIPKRIPSLLSLKIGFLIWLLELCANLIPRVEGVMVSRSMMRFGHMKFYKKLIS